MTKKKHEIVDMNGRFDKAQSLSVFSIKSLPGLMQLSVVEVAQRSQTPEGIVASVAVAAAATLVQDKVDVRLPHGQVRPASVIVIPIGQSGERKSTVFEPFFKPILDREIAKARSFNNELLKWKVDVKAYKKHTRDLKAQIARRLSRGESVQALLDDLESNVKPTAPVPFQCVHSNMTQPSILRAVSTQTSVAIANHDALSVLKQRTMENLGLINLCWDGSPVGSSRVTSDDIAAYNPRLSVLLMMQRDIFSDYLEAKGAEARSSGFLARCLVCVCRSKMGTRFITGSTRPWDALIKFQARASELLDQQVIRDANGNVERVVLEFAPDAAAFWINYYNDVEAAIAPDGYFSDIPDYASKSAEYVGRVAAIFQYIEEGSGPISLVNTQRAAEFCLWFMHQFHAIFGTRHEKSEPFRHSQDLRQWMLKKGNSCDWKWPKGKLLREGPYHLRDKATLDPALDLLVEQGYIYLESRGTAMNYSWHTRPRTPPKVSPNGAGMPPVMHSQWMPPYQDPSVERWVNSAAMPDQKFSGLFTTEGYTSSCNRA